MDHTAAAHAPGHHETATGLDTFKLGFWTFIGSESLFFASLISTYMVYQDKQIAGPSPAEILDIPLTSISTFVLLMSSLAMVIGLDGVQRANRTEALGGLLATALLGAVFLGFQAYEFTHFYHEGLTLQASVFGSSFFVLTGFHGAHVAVGVMWLLALVLMGLKGRLGPDKATTVEVAGLYWHFVDVVWIVIFTLIYLMS